uniref:Uncharacterized protein n=1 Tax=Arundo donax TaxID=35708 RepID=A0A0A9C4Y9_ARUDO
MWQDVNDRYLLLILRECWTVCIS